VNEQAKEYYEQILTLVNSFQYPMDNCQLTTFFTLKEILKFMTPYMIHFVVISNIIWQRAFSHEKWIV
jgi:hypothetical protein